MMKPMEDLFRLSMRQDLLEEFNRSYDKGLPQEDIDRNIRYLKRQLEEKYGIPFSKAAGGEIFKTGVGSLDMAPTRDRSIEEEQRKLGIGSAIREFGRSMGEDARQFYDELRGQGRSLEQEPRAEDYNLRQGEREFGRELQEEERGFIQGLEERDFTREMQDEQRLRQRENQALEDQERELIERLNREEREPMFSIDTYTFDGQEIPAITFKDGEVLTFPEIDNLFRTYKTAPETNLGPETDRQVNEYLRENNPTKEQFIRHFFLSRRLADGGEVETMGGIGALNETAKNMFR